MHRAAFGFLLLAGGLFSPEHTEAQLDVRVVLRWEIGDEGWVAYRPAHDYDAPRERVHVPPGHLPRPGYCRLWYPGVPPGHQPGPERCERLLRMRHLPAGAVIVGSPSYDYDLGYDDHPGRGRGRGKKNR